MRSIIFIALLVASVSSYPTARPVDSTGGRDIPASLSDKIRIPGQTDSITYYNGAGSIETKKPMEQNSELIDEIHPKRHLLSEEEHLRKRNLRTEVQSPQKRYPILRETVYGGLHGHREQDDLPRPSGPREDVPYKRSPILREKIPEGWPRHRFDSDIPSPSGPTESIPYKRSPIVREKVPEGMYSYPPHGGPTESIPYRKD